MRLFTAQLFAFVLFISFFCFPSDQDAAENITNGQIVLTSSVAPAEQPPVNPQSKDSWDLPQSYKVEFLFGSFLLFIGLTTIVLSLFRWKANDLSLISFGAFCFVYGARTNALQFLGKGWKSSVRRLWQIQIVFSIIAIAVSGYLQDPAAAMGLYENIEPLLHKGHGDAFLEGFGFFIFIGCLIYAVAHRFFQNEKELITLSHELETAQQIQSFILPGEGVDLENLQIAARYVPMASVAGDFYDFAKVDEKRLGILVADVSGHGVPASLFISMVKIAFASNTTHAANPSEVLAGINKVLCGKLESDFVTAGYLYLDTQEKNMAYAGAGHMPLLLWRAAEKKILEFREKGTVLGQFEDIQFKNIHIPLQPDDRIILYTDGIVETFNSAHTLFGFERLKEFIVSNAQLPAGEFADALIRQIFNWSGRPSEETLDDDLTLIVADYQHA